MYNFMIQGGWYFTLPILGMFLVCLILVVIGIARALRRSSIPGLLIDTLLFLGFLAFAYSIFGQVLGMFQAAGAVVRAGEIAPSLIWAALRVSLISVIMGFFTLLFSSVGWFILRRFRRAPTQELK